MQLKMYLCTDMIDLPGFAVMKQQYTVYGTVGHVSRHKYSIDCTVQYVTRSRSLSSVQKAEEKSSQQRKTWCGVELFHACCASLFGLIALHDYTCIDSD
jgi:hypothetical protein